MSNTENERLGLPASFVELDDTELEEYSGAAWSTPVCIATSIVVASINWCTGDSHIWGSCSFGTRACC